MNKNELIKFDITEYLDSDESIAEYLSQVRVYIKLLEPMPNLGLIPF